jgi:ribosomal protein S18 acetylase RimI-like enzyme
MPSSHQDGEAVVVQANVAEAIGRRDGLADDEIELAAIKPIDEIERAARAKVEQHAGGLLARRRGKRRRQHQSGVVVDRDGKAPLYEVEAARPVESFVERLASSIVLGAYADGRIVGVAGFRREIGPKERHKGIVWGVYVQPEARGQGVAASLIAAIIDAAREIVEQLTLTVVQGNSAAIALYRRFGFQVYGVEPRARKNPGGDKVLMVLDLQPV